MQPGLVLLQLLIGGLLLGGLYALISIGLTLIFGVLRLVNFAHGEFLMFAMYGSFWLMQLFHIDPYVSLLIVPLALAVLGVLVYKLIIARVVEAPSHVQTFATAGLSIVLMNLALMVWHGDFRTVKTSYGDATLWLGAISVSTPRLIAFAVAMLVSGGLFALLQYTMLGKAIRAVAQDRAVAGLMGIDVRRVYLWAFVLGIALVGVAGPLLIPIYYVSPTVGLHFVLIAFVVVVFGGMGNLLGALLGGLIIGVVETLSGYYLGTQMQQAVYFLVFILVLVVRPTGLLGIRGAAEVGDK